MYIISAYYRTPGGSSIDLENIIDNIKLPLFSNKQTVILRDFNYGSNQDELNMIEYLCRMKQLIVCSTRVTIISSSVTGHYMVPFRFKIKTDLPS